MDALVQFFTTFATALVATALGHFGVVVGSFESRISEPREERVIQRSRTPDRPQSAALTAP